MKSKIIVIIGPQASGKSRKAREMVNAKQHVYFDFKYKRPFLRPFTFSDVTENTESIVIDEISTRNQLYNLVLSLSENTLNIDRPCKPNIEIPRPEIILVCDFETISICDKSFNESITIIDMGLEENKYSDNIISYFQLQEEKEVSYEK